MLVTKKSMDLDLVFDVHTMICWRAPKTVRYLANKKIVTDVMFKSS